MNLLFRQLNTSKHAEKARASLQDYQHQAVQNQGTKVQK